MTRKTSWKIKLVEERKKERKKTRETVSVTDTRNQAKSGGVHLLLTKNKTDNNIALSLLLMLITQKGNKKKEKEK